MADKKISALTAKTILELTDLIPIVDISAIPIETKYITVANMLVSCRIVQGEIDNNNVLASVGWSVSFSSPIGTDVTGKDYELIITCFDSPNSTTIVGYTITNRTQLGFNIMPEMDAFIGYTAVLKT
jgi:hypothetical protein